MHESRLTADLLDRAEAAAGAPITALRLRVGLFAPVSPAGVRAAVRHDAERRWGQAPMVDVEHAGADGAVVLMSVRAAG